MTKLRYCEPFRENAERILQQADIRARCLLLCLDFTGFHLINHFYGFEAGTRLLDNLEQALLGDPRVKLCQRAFSDCYLCLAAAKAAATSEEILAACEARIAAFLAESSPSYPACSLKIACGICSVRDITLEEAIDGANTARKEAKKRGSHGAVLFDQKILSQISDAYQMERELKLALRDARFFFYLQPKVDLTTGEIIGAEALARRRDDGGAIVPPDCFLPLMESNGTIVELDLLICREVCAFMAERIRQGLPVVCTSVNLSRLHIQDPGTADQLHAIASEYRIPPSLLEFELTETILLQEMSSAKQLIDRLRAYGYPVSIDDFGSGYAGISIWQDLSFDLLKLDRRFLDEDPHLSARNAALVPNLINIGQRLQTQVLCEGVETAEQCKRLLSWGCTIAQGFYFSRPIPPEEFYTVFQRQRGAYPLPYSPEQVPPNGAEQGAEKRRAKLPRRRLYPLATLICAFLLLLCTGAVFSAYQQRTRQEFSAMITENLNAYITGQRADSQTEVENIAHTLSAFAVLIGQQADPTFIDAYLAALDEDNPQAVFLYTSAADFERLKDSGQMRQEDIRNAERLKAGDTIVSSIAYSDRLEGGYCFSVGVPVFSPTEEFLGALRGVVRADTLVSTAQFPPSQGEIVGSLLTDGSGTIIPVRADGSDPSGSLAAYLQDRTGMILSKETIAALAEALAAEDQQAHSIRLGKTEAIPYYVSLTRLSYNGWRLVVLLRADVAQTHFSSILRLTYRSSLVLLLAVLLLCAVFFAMVLRLQKNLTAEERRYLLLGQLLGTVLFEYDLCSRALHFTSNAGDLFRTRRLSQHLMAKNLPTLLIYPADYETVQAVFSRAPDREMHEMRIRLLRPRQDSYFWCLIQYRYTFEGETPVSIIGKISDIDSHQQHETYLKEQNELDAVTGLYHAAVMEKRLDQRLKQTQSAVLLRIDPVRLKRINDTFGPGEGDRALRFLAESLRTVFGKGALIGRAGSDGILVLLCPAPTRRALQTQVTALTARLDEYAARTGVPLAVNIGAARFPQDGSDRSALFRAAGQALLKAKKSETPHFCFFEQAPPANRDRYSSKT